MDVETLQFLVGWCVVTRFSRRNSYKFCLIDEKSNADPTRTTFKVESARANHREILGG